MHPTRRPSFNPEALAILERLCESTWHIFELQHPFRDRQADDDLRQKLRLKLFIRAEQSGLGDLDELQQTTLKALSRFIDY